MFRPFFCLVQQKQIVFNHFNHEIIYLKKNTADKKQDASI